VVVVDGGSMEPTYRDADRLLVTRLSGRLFRPGRFAVVVAVEPTDPRRECVKRVVGLPGETVALRAGRLVVDGAELPERFAPRRDAADFGPVTVPAGAYFLLGDNREASLDSRAWARQSPPVWVRGEMIRGRVLLRLSGR
jgi:signal peptidase I